MVTDPVAIQAMVVIKEKGLRIPEDIAVVGFGNEVFTSIFEPSLTTVDQYPNEMGKSAAKLFLNQLKDTHHEPYAPVSAPTTQVIQTKLIIRKSTAGKQK
jgi:DNA-binding LacI/PurR family transcriptional regulator